MALLPTGLRPYLLTCDANGRPIVPQASLADIHEPYALLVPGGPGSRPASRDPVLLDFVRRCDETTHTTASICTGVLILAEAGLLAGRPATTHWRAAGELEALGVRYVRRRWVEDGKYMMAAGVSAGIDMALALVARWEDDAVARTVQFALDYDPAPPLGPLDWREATDDLGTQSVSGPGS